MQEAEDAMRNSGNRHLLNRLAELDAQRAASRALTEQAAARRREMMSGGGGGYPPGLRPLYGPGSSMRMDDLAQMRRDPYGVSLGGTHLERMASRAERDIVPSSLARLRERTGMGAPLPIERDLAAAEAERAAIARRRDAQQEFEEPAAAKQGSREWKRSLVLLARLTGFDANSQAVAHYLNEANGSVEAAVRLAVQGAVGSSSSSSAGAGSSSGGGGGGSGGGGGEGSAAANVDGGEAEPAAEAEAPSASPRDDVPLVD